LLLFDVQKFSTCKLQQKLDKAVSIIFVQIAAFAWEISIWQVEGVE
jgi:hypothetical protein